MAGLKFSEGISKPLHEKAELYRFNKKMHSTFFGLAGKTSDKSDIAICIVKLITTQKKGARSC